MPSRLRVFLATVAGCLLSATPVQAIVEDGALNPGHPQTYVVQPGDTLWGIAGKFLREPWRWRELLEANPGIGSPKQLQVGDRIRILTTGGTAQARVDRHRGIPVVKLSPEVREIPLAGGIPAVPVSVVAPFLTRPYVADKTLLDRAPYVVNFVGEHITGGAGDEVYARGITDPSIGVYEIVRLGKPYEDPDTGELLGYEAAFIAEARMERPADISKLRINEMERETLAGDRLVPLEPFQLGDFLPEPAPQGAAGRILAVLRGVYEIGLYDVVVINRGSSDGLRPGSVYKVFQGGEKVHDPIAKEQWRLEWPFPYEDAPVVTWPDSNIRLPLEETGVLMVFRTFDRVSFALVMSAKGAIHVFDRIRPPQA